MHIPYAGAPVVLNLIFDIKGGHMLFLAEISFIQERIRSFISYAQAL